MPGMEHSPAPRVLIADDQADVRRALRVLLESEGFETAEVPAAERIPDALDAAEIDAVLLDLEADAGARAGTSGLEWLGRLRQIDPTLSVLGMRSWGSRVGVSEAVERGARDCLDKPWDNGRLIRALRTHVALTRSLRRGRRLEAAAVQAQQAPLPDFIAESPAMQPVVAMVKRTAPSDANVVIRGERGSGKRDAASRIHAGSHRSRAAFVRVRVGGLSDDAFDTEILGFERGAFPDAKTARIGAFERADGGTVLLEDVDRTTPEQQRRLASIVANGEAKRMGSSRFASFDVRVLATTIIDLPAEVAAGRFSSDLQRVLSDVEISLPPLRDRQEDIPLFAAAFLAEQADRYGVAIASFEPDALEWLHEAPWPGNVRELAHTVECAVAASDGDRISLSDLSRSRAEAPPRRPAPVEAKAASIPSSPGARPISEFSLEEAERYLIRNAMERCDDNVTRAAEALGLSRSALYRRLKRLEM